MKCIEVKESLNDLLDGSIDFVAKEKIGSHLGTCLACQREFQTYQTISRTLKETLPVVAPNFLDARVFSAFEQKHTPVKAENPGGWFGIPKFAFAGALILLMLISGLAFQIGRLSAENVEIRAPQISDNERTLAGSSDQRNPVETKIVEVPVVKEKIVEVPVVREKVVTRTVYVERRQKEQNLLEKDTFALNNSVKDSEFLTQTDLAGFQPVAEVKVKITKKEVEK